MYNENQDSVETTEQLEEESVETVEEPVVDDETQTTETTEAVEEKPTTVEIGGEEYTLEELNEFRQGYLRQSDYTRKTQEIAQTRKEYEEAIEMYEHLKSNPYLLDRLREPDVDPSIQQRANDLTPEMQRIRELELHMAQKELDMEISELKSKYDDFDEVKVLQEAEKRGISDLEFIYKALRESDTVDVDKIKREAVEEAKKEIMAEINNNKHITKTVINNEPNRVDAETITLTPAQKRVASGMGLTEKEYAEWLSK